MKRNFNLSRVLVLVLVSLWGTVAVRSIHVSAQTCTQCTNPPQLTQSDTWPQNTLVTVNISGSFTDEQRRCIEQAFRNWQNAGTNAGVVYQFTYGGANVGGTPNSIQIWRETPPPDPTGDQPQADITTYPNGAGTNIESAVMRVHPGVTNCTALQQAVAHEIGHTYGLGDCPNCCSGSSVMTGYNSLNDIHSGMVSPSSCDVNTARQVGQYNPATENPPSTGGSSGGGDTGGGGGGGGDIGYCTEWWAVHYECYEEEARLRRTGPLFDTRDGTFGRSHHARPFEWQCYEVDRWYLGCW